MSETEHKKPIIPCDFVPSFRHIEMIPMRSTKNPEQIQYYINKPPCCTNVVLKRYRDPPACAKTAPKVLTIHFMRGTDIIAKSYVPCPKADSPFKPTAELKILKPMEKAREGGICIYFKKKTA